MQRVKNRRRRKIYSYVSHKDLLGLNLSFGIKCPGSHIEKGTMVSYKAPIVRKIKIPVSQGRKGFPNIWLTFPNIS